jgi:hypothetical protein
VARWALGWLLFIACATAASYAWTNSLVAGNAGDEPSYAMLPISELGSTACTQATRALVAVGDGADADATPLQRARFDRASRAVLLACGHI